MIHPGKKIIEEIRNRNWTQKQFAIFVGKKNSEVNELIKGKRNITIQRDYVLSKVLGTPEKYWINMQTEYDYEQMKQKIKEEQNKAEKFEIIEDVPSKNVQEVSDVEENIEKPRENKQEEPKKENKTPVSSQNENNNIESGSTDTPKVDEISEEERQKRKEMKKIFMNF